MRRTYRGFTLIEVLIGISLGALITAALAQVLALASRDYRRADVIMTLHEQAEVALRFLRQDLRLAGYWGLAGAAVRIRGRSQAGAPNPLTLAQPRRCSPELTFDLAAFVSVANSPDSWACAQPAVTDSDVLVTRFAQPDPAVATPGRLQIHAGSVDAQLLDDGQLVHNTQPATLHNLQVMAYYVARESALFSALPVLRRLTLSATTNGPVFIDEEVAPGVELMQLAVAVDTTADGAADTWLHAGDPNLAARNAAYRPVATPLAVKVWLVMRSTDAHWPDAPPAHYRIGDLDYRAPADGHLRIVVEQTVALRNAKHQ
ncbi:MAG: PilW family protein [Pseudomonadota bacterium]